MFVVICILSFSDVFPHHGEKSALGSSGMSANIWGEYAEEPLTVKKTVNEVQTHGHQVLLSLHKKVLTTELHPLGGRGKP